MNGSILCSQSLVQYRTIKSMFKKEMIITKLGIIIVGFDVQWLGFLIKFMVLFHTSKPGKCCIGLLLSIDYTNKNIET